MTDQPTEPGAGSSPSAPSPEGSATEGSAPGGSAAEPERPASWEQRIDRFGKEAGEAGERFGKRAEAAANRWSRDPAVVGATDTAGRIWGLILLAVGAWFLADITLGYDMPSIAWRDLWPVFLIGLGLLVLVRGLTRRRA